MAILLPSTFTTYGDATTTEGGPLRKYVLAQFRSDADLVWVNNLRTALAADEVKYRNLVQARPRLRVEDRRLWKDFETGVRQATVIVIDPTPVVSSVREALHREGGK